MMRRIGPLKCWVFQIFPYQLKDSSRSQTLRIINSGVEAPAVTPTIYSYQIRFFDVFCRFDVKIGALIRCSQFGKFTGIR